MKTPPKNCGDLPTQHEKWAEEAGDYFDFDLELETDEYESLKDAHDEWLREMREEMEGEDE